MNDIEQWQRQANFFGLHVDFAGLYSALFNAEAAQRAALTIGAHEAASWPVYRLRKQITDARDEIGRRARAALDMEQ